jgi:hypothetical protein
MKNFSALLATEATLDVVVNDTATQVDLYNHLFFDANDTVVIDGIKILPKYQYLAVDGKLTISDPFYRWYHRVSGQGWLLIPQ